MLSGAGAGLDGWVRRADSLDSRALREVAVVARPRDGASSFARVTAVTSGFGSIRFSPITCFHVEWRFTPVPGKKGYNSGVFVRTSSDGKMWHQAQCGDASGGYLFGETLANYALKPFNLQKDVHEQRVKPAGEWNTYELTCKGRVVTLWVNGADDLPDEALPGSSRLHRRRSRRLANRVPQHQGQAALIHIKGTTDASPGQARDRDRRGQRDRPGDSHNLRSRRSTRRHC